MKTVLTKNIRYYLAEFRSKNLHQYKTMLKKETMRVYLGKSISFCKQIQVFTQKKNAKVVKK